MARTRDRPGRWRHYLQEHPEWWLLVVAAGAWIALAGEALVPGGGHAHGGHGPGAAHEWANAFGWWVAMVAAMMLPLARRDARWLARRSLARRRTRTVSLHVAGFLGLWVAVGAIVATVMPAVNPDTRVAAVALLAAAAWHVSPMRRRVFRRCSPGQAPSVNGFRADADCVVAGLRSGRTCLVTCGLAMVAMAATHGLASMAAVAAIGASERRAAPNPEERAGRPVEAFALAAVAVAVGLL